MTRIVENMQPTGGPFARKLPRGDEWPTHIEAAMEHDPWDSIQFCGVSDDLVFFQKSRGPPIVCDEAGEAEAKLGILKARIWSVAGG